MEFDSKIIINNNLSMTIESEIKRLSKYFSKSVHQLPGAYLVDEYNMLELEWRGIKQSTDVKNEIKRALNKTLSAKTLVKLNSVINKLNDIAASKVEDSFTKSVRVNILDKTSKYIQENNLINCAIIIEYDQDPKKIFVGISNKSNTDVYQAFNNDLDLSPYLGIIHDKNWNDLMNIFEETLVCDELFIYELSYLVELCAYKKIIQALRKLKGFTEKYYPLHTEIHIGQHDCEKFIYIVE